MARLLALLLTLALVASIVIPGDAVSRCDGVGETVGCCPATVVAVAQPSEETCCCGQPNEPVPVTLPPLDRHWLVDEVERPAPSRVAILWSHAPSDAPAAAWRSAPVLPFAGAPPPRERFCIILN